MRKIVIKKRFWSQFDEALSASEEPAEIALEMLEIALEYLEKGQPLPDFFSDHALKGDYFGKRDLHLGPDLIVIYTATKTQITLYRAGTHRKLFFRDWKWKPLKRADRGRGLFGFLF